MEITGKVLMDRIPDKEVHYICPGGFALRFADGEVIEFDFCHSSWWAEGMYLIFESSDLDISTFPESAKLRDKIQNTRIEEIEECFIYTGEDGDDPEINPIRLLTNTPRQDVEVDISLW